MKITIIGAGRVGSAVAERLFEKGFSVVQVFSRDGSTARLVAEKVGAEPIDSLEKIDDQTDAFLIATPDAAIFSTAKMLSKTQPDALAVHFSGATERAVLAAFFEKNGVIWPIQSFSSAEKPDWRRLPMALEASEKGRVGLFKIARKLGPRLFETDGPSRERLHLAATMANNFSNHLFALVGEFLAEKSAPNSIRGGQSLDPLLPLIESTFSKIKAGGDPRLLQTGPARRGDSATIERHLALLADEPKLAELYRFFSASIAEKG